MYNLEIAQQYAERFAISLKACQFTNNVHGGTPVAVSPCSLSAREVNAVGWSVSLGQCGDVVVIPRIS